MHGNDKEDIDQKHWNKLATEIHYYTEQNKITNFNIKNKKPDLAFWEKKHSIFNSKRYKGQQNEAK